MSDNAVQALQKLVQDLIAPDVRETKVRLAELEKRMDARFDASDKSMAAGFAALRDQMDANNRMLLSSIGELKAQTELTALRAVAELRERVAVLESRTSDSPSRAA